VRLHAVDVDGLDINFTRAEIFLHLTDANQHESKFPFTTEIGSSIYTMVVAGAATKEPGHYTLVVRVPKGPTGSCEILRRAITVTADTTQLIVALVLVGVLLGVFALGSYLLYKNRERAMNFLLSFLSYEVTIAADIVLEMWDFAGMRNVPLPGVWGMRCGACVCDFAGDAFFFVEVKKQSSKPWVARLSTPYTVFFALACAVSLAAVVTKTRLLVLKLQSRLEGPNVTNRRRLSVGGVAIAPVLSAAVVGSDSTIVELKSKFDDLRLQRKLAYCHIASALLEDLPMGKRP